MITVRKSPPEDDRISAARQGLYKKARAGEIKHFTGIDDPYEAPVQPEVHIHNHDRSVEEVVAEVLAQLQARELLS